MGYKVLYDPPYSTRQVSECYKGVGMNVTMQTTQASWRARHLDEIARILKPDGACLCFGWNTNGVGKKRNFEPFITGNKQFTNDDKEQLLHKIKEYYYTYI